LGWRRGDLCQSHSKTLVAPEVHDLCEDAHAVDDAALSHDYVVEGPHRWPIAVAEGNLHFVDARTLPDGSRDKAVSRRAWLCAALAQDRREIPRETAQSRRRRVTHQGLSGRCVAGVDVNPDAQPHAIFVVERFGERGAGLIAVGPAHARTRAGTFAASSSCLAPRELAPQQHELFGERLLGECLIAPRMARGAGQGAREAVHEREGRAPVIWGDVTTGPGTHDANAVDAWAAKQVHVLLGKAIGVAPCEVSSTRRGGRRERDTRRSAPSARGPLEEVARSACVGEHKDIGDHVVAVGGPPAQLITPGIA
jgi:hypothetical protein